MNPPERNAPPVQTLLRRGWRQLNEAPLLVQIVGGTVAAVLAALVLLALAFDSRDSPNSTGGASREALEDPRNATEEIATRSLWRDPPQLFAQGEDTLSYEGDGNGPYIGQVVATDFFGNVQAYDPEGLAQAGASIQGLPVISLPTPRSGVSLM